MTGITDANGVTPRPGQPVRLQVWIDRIVEGNPRLKTAMRWTLLLSMCLHLSTIPLIPDSGKLSADAERFETEYMKKVQAAKVSKIVARDIKDRIVMPPPPPDPEARIAETLSKEMTSDIKKVVSEVAEVDLSEKLADHVARVFKDEWAEAAKQIAQGKLSKEEIKKLQAKYRVQVQEEATKALKEHRIETQVERATLTATEWYEKKVATAVFPNMRMVLNGYRGRAGVWRQYVVGVYSGWGPGLNFSGIASSGLLSKKLGYLGKLVKEHTKLPPSEANASRFLGKLRHLHKGHIGPRGTYPSASWRTIIHGGQDHHVINTHRYTTHLSSGILAEFHPHRLEKMTPIAEQADAAFKKALEDGEAYVKAAQEGASDEELKKSRDVCLKSVNGIISIAAKLRYRENSRYPHSYPSINALVRSQVLRSPLRKELYDKWIDDLTRELQSLIKKFAKGQFKKGIIVHKKSTTEALKEFSEDIVPLLRRDLRKMWPEKVFNSRLFGGGRKYSSPVTGDTYYCPRPKDAKNDDALLAKVLSEHPDRAVYAEKRRERIQQHLRDAIHNVKESLMNAVFTGNLLLNRMSSFVEGADYADKVKERLDARAQALNGRGQDYARLTNGVPDTSAAMFSLEFGGPKGSGASIQPVMAALSPGYITRSLPARVVRKSLHAFPPPPAKWGLTSPQEKVKPKFKSPRFEAIPFLLKFPRLDGDLSEWARIRPLKLKASKGKESVLFYAAWNYLGFFFAYDVKMPMERYYYAEYDRRRGGRPTQGDFLHLMFDTLDARNTNRGEPHTQEFILLPRGTHVDPDFPGLENVISSQRDAQKKQYRGVKSAYRPFASQPPLTNGPDGEGPYRVTRIRNKGPLAEQGYTVEVFIPRKLFNTPVFAPGWYVGFDCQVAMGYQSKRRPNRQAWSSGKSTSPSTWGDLLLLGTDARVIVQEANAKGSRAYGVVPGHSYLLTVIDPDRNVSLTQKDTVLVSAEVRGGKQDTEIFILKETENNSGIFRGYVNTQPGRGGEVLGVVEVLAGDEVRLGYVDFGNAKGGRNVVAEVRLPVTSGLMLSSAKKR